MRRTFPVVVLMVVAGLLVPFTLIGVWAQRVLLDRSHLTALSDELLARRAVRVALADEIVAQLEMQLPELDQLQGTVQPVAVRALDTPAFDTDFNEALAQVYKQLDAGDTTITLNLDPSLKLVRARLEPIAPELAGDLPSGSQISAITLVRRSDWPVVWGAVSAASGLWLPALLLALVCFAGAVLLARRRLRALGIAGVVAAGVALVLFVALVIVEHIADRTIESGVDESAFEATWDVVTRELRNSVLVTLAIGLLLATAAAAAALVAARRDASSDGPSGSL